jgi:hypothetical protein
MTAMQADRGRVYWEKEGGGEGLAASRYGGSFCASNDGAATRHQQRGGIGGAWGCVPGITAGVYSGGGPGQSCELCAARPAITRQFS